VRIARAVDAQARASEAEDDILQGLSGENIAFVTHGSVGRLLLCKCLRVSINHIATSHVTHLWLQIAPCCGWQIIGHLMHRVVRLYRTGALH
jgi:broad specificity phosphatase PhoE